MNAPLASILGIILAIFANATYGYEKDSRGDLIGTPGNDEIPLFEASGTYIDGRKGTDTVVVPASSSQYEWISAGGLTKLSGSISASRNISILLANIERIKFDDKTITVDTPEIDAVSFAFTENDDLFVRDSNFNNVLLGKAGNDSVFFFFSGSQTTLITHEGVTKVEGKDQHGRTFRGFLHEIEHVHFTDASFELDAPRRFNSDYQTRHEDGWFAYFGVSPALATTGNNGVDTLIVFANSGDFTIETLQGVSRITATSSAPAPYQSTHMTIGNIERIAYLDTTIELPVDPRVVFMNSYVQSQNDDVFYRTHLQIVKGGGGEDVLVIFGERKDTRMVVLAGVARLDGKVTLESVEAVQFRDQLVELDTSGPAVLRGTERVVVGTAGDDIIDSIAQVRTHNFFIPESVDGGGGEDTLLIFAESKGFLVSNLGGRATIEGINAASFEYQRRVIELYNIEKIQFSDQVVTLDADPREVLRPVNGKLETTDEDNLLDPDGFNMRIDGKGGVDTLLIFKHSDNYTVTTLGGLTKVSSNQRQLLTLINVERIEFADKVLELETANRRYHSEPSETDSYRYIGTSADESFDIMLLPGRHSSTDPYFTGDVLIDGKGGNDTLLLFVASDGFVINTVDGITELVHPRMRLLTVEVETILFTDREISVNAPERVLVSDFRRFPALLEGTDLNEHFETSSNSPMLDGRGGVDTYVYFEEKDTIRLESLSGLTRLINQFGVPIRRLARIESIEFLDGRSELPTTDSAYVFGDSSGLIGTQNDDYLVFPGAYIDGGRGKDRLLVFEQSDDFSVQSMLGVTRLVNSSRNYLLVNTEEIQFLDKIIALDTDQLNFVRNTGSGNDPTLGDEADNIFEGDRLHALTDGAGGHDTLLIFDDREFYDIRNLFGVTKIWNLIHADYHFSGNKLLNIETISFVDESLDLITRSLDIIFGEGHTERLIATTGDDLIDPAGGRDIVFGLEGHDRIMIFEDASFFEIISIGAVTRLKPVPTPGTTARYNDFTVINAEELHFLDQMVPITSRGNTINDANYFAGSSGAQSFHGTPEDDVFDPGGGSDEIDGGDGFDTVIMFASMDQFEHTTVGGVTKLTVVTDIKHQDLIHSVMTLENVEAIQFIDGEIRLDRQIDKDDNRGAAYLFTTSTSANDTTLHLINTSNTEQMFLGTLFNAKGEQLGAADVPLSTSSIRSNGRLVLTAADLEQRFDIAPWQGPAMLEVQANGAFELMSKLKSPSGLVSNTNCVRSDVVHNLEGGDSENKSYVRFINTGQRSIPQLRGTLFDEQGNILGEASSLLFETLPSKAAVWLTKSQLEDIFGGRWQGLASLRVEEASGFLKLLNLNLVEDETFFNFSCYESNDSSMVFLQTTSASSNLSETHIVNRSDRAAMLTADLFDRSGTRLTSGKVPLTSTAIEPNGRLVFNSKELESVLGISPWTGPALLEVYGGARLSLMTRLKSPSGLISNTNCVRTHNAHNLEGKDSENLTFLRLINSGDGILEGIRGTLFDQSGEIMGTPDQLLLTNLEAREAVWFSRTDLSDVFGVTWSGEATIQVTAEVGEGLRLLNLNQTADSTFFNFSCYESSVEAPRVSASISGQLIKTDDNFTMSIPETLFDDGTGSLGINVTGLPEGLNFDGDSTISGLVANNAAGEYTVYVTATDEHLHSTTTTFTLIVVDSADFRDWRPGLFLSAHHFENICTNPGSFGESLGDKIDENNWLRSWSNNTYLWYDEIEDINPAEYDTPDYFDLMKTFVRPPGGGRKDKFHYSTKTDQANVVALAASSDDAVGYGMEYVISAGIPRSILVGYVEPDSPAERAGIRRGDEIMEFNGRDAQFAFDVEALFSALYPTRVGERHEFTLRLVDTGALREVTVTAELLPALPVLTSKILATEEGNVGYLLFNDHIASAEDPLVNAFREFQSAGVTDLILDLRYNSGGLLDIASEVAYMIAGRDQTTGKTFELQQFNEKHTQVNPVTLETIEPIPFYTSTRGFGRTINQPLPTLSLARVAVLTTGTTCSSSEAIINGLRGVDVEVIQIGSITCGKPYGFYPTANCGTTYYTIQFRGLNNKGFGGYENGFTTFNHSVEEQAVLPGCSSYDDFSNALGDPQELMTAKALSYLASGQCTVSSSARARPKSSAPIDEAGIMYKSIFRSNRILSAGQP